MENPTYFLVRCLLEEQLYLRLPTKDNKKPMKEWVKDAGYLITKLFPKANFIIYVEHDKFKHAQFKKIIYTNSFRSDDILYSLYIFESGSIQQVSSLNEFDLLYGGPIFPLISNIKYVGGFWNIWSPKQIIEQQKLEFKQCDDFSVENVMDVAYSAFGNKIMNLDKILDDITLEKQQVRKMKESLINTPDPIIDDKKRAERARKERGVILFGRNETDEEASIKIEKKGLPVIYRCDFPSSENSAIERKVCNADGTFNIQF